MVVTKPDEPPVNQEVREDDDQTSGSRRYHSPGIPASHPAGPPRTYPGTHSAQPAGLPGFAKYWSQVRPPLGPPGGASYDKLLSLPGSIQQPLACCGGRRRMANSVDPTEPPLTTPWPVLPTEPGPPGGVIYDAINHAAIYVKTRSPVLPTEPGLRTTTSPVLQSEPGTTTRTVQRRRQRPRRPRRPGMLYISAHAYYY